MQAIKRRYSVVRDTPEDLRRVRTRTDENPTHITKFKKVDVVRNHPGIDYKRASAILSEVPLSSCLTNHLQSCVHISSPVTSSC